MSDEFTAMAMVEVECDHCGEKFPTMICRGDKKDKEMICPQCRKEREDE